MASRANVILKPVFSISSSSSFSLIVFSTHVRFEQERMDESEKPKHPEGQALDLKAWQLLAFDNNFIRT